MWLRSVVASLLLTLALVMYVLDAVSFLAPYRRTLIAGYLGPAFAFVAMWVLNVAVLIYLVVRLVTLGRVGRRLQHVSRDRAPFDVELPPSPQEDAHA
jgi:uncharacterized membrane protein